MTDNESAEDYFDANDHFTSNTRFIEDSTPQNDIVKLENDLANTSFRGGKNFDVYDENDMITNKEEYLASRGHPLSAHIVRRESERRSLQDTAQQGHGDDKLQIEKSTLPTNDDRTKPMSLLVRLGLKKARPAQSPIIRENTSEQGSENGSNDETNNKDDDVGGDDNSMSDQTYSNRSSMEYNTSFDLSNGPASPQQLTPTNEMSYIKVKSNGQPASGDLSQLVLAQVMDTSRFEDSPDPSQSKGSVWTMKFSKDGQYLAAGGRQCIVRLWKVRGPEVSQDDIKQSESVHVFEDKPEREYTGHTADILALSWSKNNFLLSSSMDKTVRLWHASRQECLCIFRHLDFVTSIQFHPKDDRYFLSGSLDGKLRIWNIPEKKVTRWTELPEENMVTAVAFTQDANTVCAGSHTGLCFFYETQDLRYITQVTVYERRHRSSRRGRKVTGIEPMPGLPPGEEKVLITTNDSRIRLYDMQDKSLMYTYKGPVNASMQIRATFSDDGKRIVCGSENGNVYTWNTYSVNDMSGSTDSILSSSKTLPSRYSSMSHSAKWSVWIKRSEQHILEWVRSRNEHFPAHDSVVTVAIFAPGLSRQRLAMTMADKIYNHTPDTSTSDLSDNSRPFSDNMTAEFYRQTFTDGAILVSADSNGYIKIWRRDSGVYQLGDSKEGRPSSVLARKRGLSIPTRARWRLGLLSPTKRAS